MSHVEDQKDRLEYVEKWLKEIEEIVDGSKLKKAANDKATYESINKMLGSIADDRDRVILQKILSKTRELNVNDYSPKHHIELIISYELVGSVLTGKLSPSLLYRFQQHLNKEVGYLRMQAPDSELYKEISNTAVASIANLTPLAETKVSKQQFLLDALFGLILDFRLSTLNEEQAWDYIAQTILRETGN